MLVDVPREVSQIMLDYGYEPPSDDPGIRRCCAQGVGDRQIVASESNMVDLEEVVV